MSLGCSALSGMSIPQPPRLRETTEEAKSASQHSVICTIFVLSVPGGAHEAASLQEDLVSYWFMGKGIAGLLEVPHGG